MGRKKVGWLADSPAEATYIQRPSRGFLPVRLPAPGLSSLCCCRAWLASQEDREHANDAIRLARIMMGSGYVFLSGTRL